MELHDRYFLTFEQFTGESSPMTRSVVPDLSTVSDPDEVEKKMRQAVERARESINKALEASGVDYQISKDGGGRMPEVMFHAVENDDAPRFDLIWHARQSVGKQGLDEDWYKEVEGDVLSAMEKAVKDHFSNARIQGKRTHRRDGNVIVTFDLE